MVNIRIDTCWYPLSMFPTVIWSYIELLIQGLNRPKVIENTFKKWQKTACIHLFLDNVSKSVTFTSKYNRSTIWRLISSIRNWLFFLSLSESIKTPSSIGKLNELWCLGKSINKLWVNELKVDFQMNQR